MVHTVYSDAVICPVRLLWDWYHAIFYISVSIDGSKKSYYIDTNNVLKTKQTYSDERRIYL